MRARPRPRRIGFGFVAAAVALVLANGYRRPAGELTILHVNDLHARLSPGVDGRGGFARVAGVLKREAARSRAHLTLHAGDLVQGSPVSSIYEGVPVYGLAAHLGIDVGCLGNHEFDYGWRKISEFERAGGFELVSANVVDDEGRTLVPAYVVREVGGLRVAVVGAMIESLARLVRAPQRGPWRATPLVETLRPHVEKARAESDLVVVLGHISLEEQERVLRELPGVDVVVGGHDHRGRRRPFEHQGRVAVNARGNSAEVGRLDLRYDVEARRVESYTWRGIPVDARQPAEPAVAAWVEEWEAKVAEVVDVPIGQSRRRLDRGEVRALMQRALAERTGADFAYLGSGGIRGELPAGRLLARHVWDAMPFDDTVPVDALAHAEGVDLAHGHHPLADRDAEDAVLQPLLAARGLDLGPAHEVVADHDEVVDAGPPHRQPGEKPQPSEGAKSQGGPCRIGKFPQ